MATDPRKRQKQLAKKKAKRKTVAVAKKTVDKHGGMFPQTTLEKAPIHKCIAPSRLFETGIGTVIMARKLPNGNIGAGFFMLDVWCLGVKNAFFTILTLPEYQQQLLEIRQRENLQTISFPCARKLIEDSAAYAEELGFSPDPDYKKAKIVFGDIKADECLENFEFGKEGKPFYMNGPYDTPEKSRKIINQLTKKCGPEGFHYTAHPSKL
ncbi:MAG TPA: hypothetical protein ENG03_11400 [Thioploca sp.]|nr:MAG: hypothetical protein DRR08_21860 [Gammaproteobacteria bacterium]HDN27678.1 hypothetical protein [Thioploca sp.]